MRLLFATLTNRFAERHQIDNPPARKRIDHQTAVVRRRHLQGLRRQAQNTVFVFHHVLNERDFEAQTGVFLDLFDLTELHDQSLLAFIDDEHRRHHGSTKRHHNRKHISGAHQLVPPVVVAAAAASGNPINSPSGNTGSTL